MMTTGATVLQKPQTTGKMQCHDVCLGNTSSTINCWNNRRDKNGKSFIYIFAVNVSLLFTVLLFFFINILSVPV